MVILTVVSGKAIQTWKRGRRGGGVEDRSSDKGSLCKVTSTPVWLTVVIELSKKAVGRVLYSSVAHNANKTYSNFVKVSQPC